MVKFKLIIALALISAISCDNQFAENLKNAKPISEHPRYQEHQLRKNFPKDLNNNVEISPFIVGGQPAELGQFPHHALIFIVYPNLGMYLCGGSVIDRNWILTAGHCVYGGAEYFEIYLGVVSMLGPAKWVARIYPNDTILHSEYDDNTLNNDIAMIKLVNAPEDLFFDPSIAPIAIPSEQVDLLDRNGTVIGFGRFSDNSTSVSENLKFTTLKTISNEQCALVFVPGVVRDTNFCAETNAQSSTCGGDSGGSYIFNINGLDRLEGITSFGAQIGCQLGYPVGFTRVTSYLDWIYYNINGGTTPPPDTDSIWRRILQIIIEILKKIFGRN